LRSFRTHIHKELIALGSNHFFINVEAEQQQIGITDAINIGFSIDEGKLVKYNGKSIQSYKELVSNYRIVTLAADDLVLVHGAPEVRRDFLNCALFLLNPNFLFTFKRYRQILDHRNSLFCGFADGSSLANHDELEIWSKKLWDETQIIRATRVEYLHHLEEQVNQLLHTYFSKTDADLSIEFEYLDKAKQLATTFDDFWQTFYPAQLAQEYHLGRSLFGIHLDDFSIVFQNKRARVFASRGQQKLIVFLIKVAQLLELGRAGEPGVLLLDDFLTDFDDQRICECFDALCRLPLQVILTCPTNASVLDSGLALSDRIGGFSVVSLL
jgi:DNA replication and repair protein RecF